MGHGPALWSGCGGRPSLTCCAALSASTANSTDRPFSACFRDPHVLLFRAAQEGSGVVSDPKALKENATGDTQALKLLAVPADTGLRPTRHGVPAHLLTGTLAAQRPRDAWGLRGGRASAQNPLPLLQRPLWAQGGPGS